VADKTKRKNPKRPPLKDVDQEITALFQQGSSRSKRHSPQKTMKNQLRRLLGSSRALQRHQPKGCVGL
jgi:hypothetical protein